MKPKAQKLLSLFLTLVLVLSLAPTAWAAGDTPYVADSYNGSKRTAFSITAGERLTLYPKNANGSAHFSNGVSWVTGPKDSLEIRPLSGGSQIEITGYTPGTYVVQLLISTGGGGYNYTDNLTFTVRAGTAPSGNLTLTNLTSTASLKPGDSCQFQAKVIGGPANTEYTFRWEPTGAGAYVGITNSYYPYTDGSASIHFASAGTSTIQVTATPKNGGASLTQSMTVKVKSELPVIKVVGCPEYLVRGGDSANVSLSVTDAKGNPIPSGYETGWSELYTLDKNDILYGGRRLTITRTGDGTATISAPRGVKLGKTTLAGRIRMPGETDWQQAFYEIQVVDSAPDVTPGSIKIEAPEGVELSNLKPGDKVRLSAEVKDGLAVMYNFNWEVSGPAVMDRSVSWNVSNTETAVNFEFPTEGEGDITVSATPFGGDTLAMKDTVHYKVSGGSEPDNPDQPDNPDKPDPPAPISVTASSDAAGANKVTSLSFENAASSARPLYFQFSNIDMFTTYDIEWEAEDSSKNVMLLSESSTGNKTSRLTGKHSSGNACYIWITPMNAGSDNLKVTVKDGGKTAASLSIPVTVGGVGGSTGPINNRYFAVSAGSATLTLDQSIPINAEITDSRGAPFFSWTVDNPDVVKIADSKDGIQRSTVLERGITDYCDTKGIYVFPQKAGTATISADLTRLDSQGYITLGQPLKITITVKDGSDNPDNPDKPDDPDTYTITYRPGTGSGAVYTDTLAASASGARLTLPYCTFTAPTGYRFRGWQVGSGTIVYAARETVTITDDVTVTALWEPASDTYTLNISYDLGYYGGWSSNIAYHPNSITCYTNRTNTFRPDAPVSSGRRFLGWTYPGQPTPVSVITIPSSYRGGTLYLTANWEEDGYRVRTRSASHGSIISNVDYAGSGSTVTLTARPDRDYEVSSVTVTNTSTDRTVSVSDYGNNQYRFTMPASSVTVEVTFREIVRDLPAQDTAVPEVTVTPAAPETPVMPSTPSVVYADVRPADWYYNSVQYMTQQGLMRGTSADSFAPKSNTTRAMVWTMLARMAGQDTDGGSTWYQKGLDWCKASGITDGSNPNGTITREQLATMLWRSEGSPSGGTELARFTDAGQISSYAQDALRWAVSQNIVSGKGGGVLDPQGLATRAEVAQMFMNFMIRAEA